MADVSKMTDTELDAYIAQQQQAITQLQGSVAKSAAIQKQEQVARESEKRGLLSTGKAWLSGADKDPSIPVYGETVGTDELGYFGEKGDLLNTAVITSFDDQSLMQAIKKVEPDTKFQQDQFGNLVAGAPIRDASGNITEYKKFYPNPKGLDAPTATQAVGAIALGGPTAQATKAVGLPTTGYKGAAVTGMTEAGLLEAMSAQSAGRPFRLSEIPSGALGGAIGKGVIDVGGLVVNIAKAFKGNPEQFVQRTPEVEKAIIDAGFDPAVVMPEVRSEIERMVRQGLDPLESARTTAAASLPYPVRLTSGQVTGSKGQQVFETDAAARSYGDRAEGVMQNRFREQQEAISKNIPAIQQQMAGEELLIRRGEGMAGAQAELVASKTKAEQAYKDAYKGAGGTGSFFIPENTSAASSVIDERVYGAGFRRESSPAAFALQDELIGMLEEGRSLKDLFEFRKSMTKLQMAGGTESGAASALKGAFDDVLVEHAEKGLLYGNPADVAAGLDAISKFKDFKRTWDTKGVLTKLTTQETRDGATVLKVAPEDAANAILGKSIAQSTSKMDLARDLLTLKKNLSPEQWNQVRQEVFINLSDTMHRTGKVEKEASLMFNKAWQNLKEKNPSIVKVIFSKEEISVIDNLSGTSALVAATERNASNTAVSMMGAFQRLASSLGASGGVQMLLRAKGMSALTNMVADMRLVPTLRGAMTPAGRAVESFAAGSGAGATMGMDSPIIEPLQQGLINLQGEE